MFCGVVSDSGSSGDQVPSEMGLLDVPCHVVQEQIKQTRSGLCSSEQEPHEKHDSILN